MTTFSLDRHSYIKLCDLLKLEGWNESDMQAKIAIAEGQVKVDGAVETRKRCKIVAGQAVSFAGHGVQVVAWSLPRPVSTGQFSFRTSVLYVLPIHTDSINTLPK